VDIKSWDIQNFFIVYQTFALSQIVRLTVVTLTSLSGKIKIMSNVSDIQKQTIQKTDSVNNYQLFNLSSNLSLLESSIVPRTDAALPRCTAMLILWLK
jgi:hypothetical protein